MSDSEALTMKLEAAIMELTIEERKQLLQMLVERGLIRR